jgi:pSer/pThr/pTyr-binding forkhead associated (FHA) protein
MPKLVLKFGDSVLKELQVGRKEVSIGRSPNNGLVIDNPAVSNRHARVFSQDEHLMLEDFGSLNGTFVNGQRVKSASLNPGDAVTIGKHTILVEGTHELDGFAVWTPRTKPLPVAPQINETIMLDTKERREFVQKLAAEGERSQLAPGRQKLATLVVIKGKTDQREYTLTDKLTVIGKSSMATVKLLGWFAPKAAAQINRRDDNSHYIGAAGRLPKVNGKPVKRPVKLETGDVIEVAGIKLEFHYRD